MNNVFLSLTWCRLGEHTSRAPGMRTTSFSSHGFQNRTSALCFHLSLSNDSGSWVNPKSCFDSTVVCVEAGNEIVLFGVRPYWIQISSLILGFGIIRSLVKQPWTHLYGYCWRLTIRPHLIIYLLNNSFCSLESSSPILKDNGDIFIFHWV